jgi:hypothetical protein
MYDPQTVRTCLADYFAEKADFRASKEDKPWETKNRNYEASLRLLVEYIKALPDDDATMLKLAAYEELFMEDVFDAPRPNGWDGVSTTDNEAIHFGPRWEVIETADLAEEFAAWAETAIAEALEQRERQAEQDSEEDEARRLRAEGRDPGHKK